MKRKRGSLDQLNFHFNSLYDNYLASMCTDYEFHYVSYNINDCPYSRDFISQHPVSYSGEKMASLILRSTNHKH